MAGRIFGEVGGSHLLLRALQMMFYMSRGSFSWQEQYLVTLDGEVCCSAQCQRRFICDDDQS